MMRRDIYCVRGCRVWSSGMPRLPQVRGKLGGIGGLGDWIHSGDLRRIAAQALEERGGSCIDDNKHG